MSVFYFNNGVLYCSGGNVDGVVLSEITCKNDKAKKHLRKIELALRDCQRNRLGSNFTHKDVMSILKKDVEVFRKKGIQEDLEALSFVFFPNQIQGCLLLPKTSCKDLNFSILMSCVKKYMTKNYLERNYNAIQKETFEVSIFKYSAQDVEKLTHLRKMVEAIYEYFDLPLVKKKDVEKED